MPDVNDVAAAVIAEFRRQYPDEPITALKLQKLVYYAQAWHLADTGAPLFDEAIEAWRDGPVVRALFAQHQGWRTIDDWTSGRAERVPPQGASVISRVVRSYGALDAETLGELTHREMPWRATRFGLGDEERSNRVIDLRLIATFYARQRSEPKTAVAFALASVRLEGGVVSDGVVRDMDAVAQGHLSADDAVIQRLALLHQ
jgi:uncharacterized phage-associated protein